MTPRHCLGPCLLVEDLTVFEEGADGGAHDVGGPE